MSQRSSNRPVTRSTKRKRASISRGFQRLKALPNFDDVHQRLASGLSIDYIARWLQTDLSLCTDISCDGLKRQLFRYRDTIPLPERSPRKIKLLEERIREYAGQINVLKEITRLYQFQCARLDATMEQHGELSLEMGRELDRAMGYIERLGDVKHRLGLFHRGSGAPELETEINPADSMQAGAVQAVINKYGPDAPVILASAGRKLHARMIAISRQRERQERLGALQPGQEITPPHNSDTESPQI
jgi:hypothetical protein